MATEEPTARGAAGAARLKAWALSPEGRARIGLNGPTPFRSCVIFYTGKLPQKYIKGMCAELVHEATGHWPNEGRGDKG
jgi:hypothetical protein